MYNPALPAFPWAPYLEVWFEAQKGIVSAPRPHQPQPVKLGGAACMMTTPGLTAMLGRVQQPLGPGRGPQDEVASADHWTVTPQTLPEVAFCGSRFCL